jgi:hypothetical protein
MENGEWRMENGEWRMENGEWRMENGEWRMENGVEIEEEDRRGERWRRRCYLIAFPAAKQWKPQGTINT